MVLNAGSSMWNSDLDIVYNGSTSQSLPLVEAAYTSNIGFIVSEPFYVFWYAALFTTARKDGTVVKDLSRRSSVPDCQPTRRGDIERDHWKR